MPAKATNIIAHILFPGLAFAFLVGDRQESKAYLVRNMWLNFIMFLLHAIQLFPFFSNSMVYILSTLALSMFWGYSLLGAIAGLPSPASFADGGYLNRGINNIRRLKERHSFKTSPGDERAYYSYVKEPQNELSYYGDNLVKGALYMVKLFLSILLIGMTFACSTIALVSVLAAIRGAALAVGSSEWSFSFGAAFFGVMLTIVAIAILFISAVIAQVRVVRHLLYNNKRTFGKTIKVCFIVGTCCMIAGCVGLVIALLLNNFSISNVFFIFRLP